MGDPWGIFLSPLEKKDILCRFFVVSASELFSSNLLCVGSDLNLIILLNGLFQIIDELIVDIVRQMPKLKATNYYGEEFCHIDKG